MLYLAPLELRVEMANIVYIRQFRGRKEVVYDLELTSSDLSRAIRNKYGTFWRKKNRPPMPEILDGVSIANSLTFASRVRIGILKEISKCHTKANPGLECFVTNYLPRPVLKLRDKGPIQTFGYVDSIRRFGHHLTPQFLASQTRFAKTNIPVEKLKSTFLVLSPDLLAQEGPHDLSLVSVPEDQDMQEVSPDFSQPIALDTGPSGSGKGEKRKATDKPAASMKKAANVF